MALRNLFFRNSLSIINNCKTNKVNPRYLVRLLNYSSKEYSIKERNPAPIFFQNDVQTLLKTLTRVDLNRVFRKRKLGEKRLEDPKVAFMTHDELQRKIEEAKKKADELLQIPPILQVRKPINRVLSQDPALQGLETSRMVFTDITFGVKDSERLILVREPNGDLKEAEWELRDRINQVYFPQPGRQLTPPKLFEEVNLERLLKNQEYEFILDSACSQFDPDDPEYQRVTTITYQHINDNNSFELLRSTRHFGALAFFLCWHKNIDNLLLDIIETMHLEEANALIVLYSKINNFKIESDGQYKAIEEFIKKHANKKGALELALQAYKDAAKEREEIEKGVKAAHGLR